MFDLIFSNVVLWFVLVHSIRRLGLEYVDLYLIHFPVRLRQGVAGTKYSKGDILPFDMKGTWEDMEQCYKLGLAKSIGVSNFGVKKLSQILQNATVPPAVDQVHFIFAHHFLYIFLDHFHFIYILIFSQFFISQKKI